MGKILLGAVQRHLKDNAIIRHGQHRFTKGESCLINVVSFNDDVTKLGDEGKAMDAVFLDFSEAQCPSQDSSKQVFIILWGDQVGSVPQGSVLGEVLSSISVRNSGTDQGHPQQVCH